MILMIERESIDGFTWNCKQNYDPHNFQHKVGQIYFDIMKLNSDKTEGILIFIMYV
jgi:hypothetical protein